ncbi:hypothetical protein IC575_023158 [Cucumis melo]
MLLCLNGDSLDISKLYRDEQWRPKLQLPEALYCSHSHFLHYVVDLGGDVLVLNQLHKQGSRLYLLLYEVYCHHHFLHRRQRLHLHLHDESH